MCTLIKLRVKHSARCRSVHSTGRQAEGMFAPGGRGEGRKHTKMQRADSDVMRSIFLPSAPPPRHVEGNPGKSRNNTGIDPSIIEHGPADM